MVQGMEANAYLCDLCQEFARQRQQVRAEVSEVSNLILSAVYQPLGDCTYGRPRQHFPNCVRRHVIAELRGQ
jgi:hypothetical protein